MDVYEQEFGDLLVVHEGRTVQQQFYSDIIKRVTTLYSFLPKELLECRMQKYWEKFLLQNPHLRKKHEAEMKAIQALCSSDLRHKAPQRKPRQRFGDNLQSVRTRQREAGRTSDDNNARANLSRPRNRRQRAVEQRYVPLDIQTTRSSPAAAEPGKQLTAENRSTEEPEENKEKLRDEGLPLIPQMAADETSNAPQQDDPPPDIVAHFEEVGRLGSWPAVPKHSAGARGSSLGTGKVPPKAQHMLPFQKNFSSLAGTKGDTKHTTSSSSPTHHVHNAAHEGPLSAQATANASILETLQQHRGKAGTHLLEGRRADLSDSRCKPGGHPNGRETKETAPSGLPLHKQAPMDSSTIAEQDDGHETGDCRATAGKQERGSVHFASQVTVSISSSASDDDRHETCDYAATADEKRSVHFASQLTVSISPSTSDGSRKVEDDRARESSDSTESGMKKEGTMQSGKPEPPASDCNQAESENTENVVKQSQANCTRDQKMEPRDISGLEREAPPVPQKDLLECIGGRRQHNKLSLPKPNRTMIAASTNIRLNDPKSTETRSLKEPNGSGNDAAIANISAPGGHEKTAVKAPRQLPSFSELKSVATENSSNTQQNATKVTPASPTRMHRKTSKGAGNVQSEPLTCLSQGVMAQFAASKEKMLQKPSQKLGTNATLLKKGAGTHEKTGLVASSHCTEGKENVTTNAALPSLAQPQQMELRGDKTPRKMTRSSARLATTPGAGVSPPDKPARGEPTVDATASRNKDDRHSHPNRHGPTYDTEMAGEKTSEVVTKDAFKTPNLERPKKAVCPPTPLKQRALKKRTLKKTANQSKKEQLAVSEELQSDPETPFGFKLKRLKLQLTRCDVMKQMLLTRSESSEDEHSEKDQAVLYRRGARAEAGPARDNRRKVDDSGKERNKPGKNIKHRESSSTTQPEIPAHLDEEKAENANEQPEVSFHFKNKKSNASSTDPSISSVEANAKKTKQQLGGRSSNMSAETGEMLQTNSQDLSSLTQHPSVQGSFEMLQTNSQDLSSLTQHPNVQGRFEMLQTNSQDLSSLTQQPNVEGRLRAAQIKLSVETKARRVNAFKPEKEDGFPCFIETLDGCILYSQVETRKDTTPTVAVRDAFMVEANMEQGLTNTKQKAERRHGHTGVDEERVTKRNGQKQGRGIEDSSREPRLDTGCNDNSSSFFDFDTPAAERHEPSTGFFQLKLSATPLSFSDDKNEADQEEVFPWLASSTRTADTQKRSQSQTSGPHLKCTNQEASQRPSKVDANSAGSDLVWPSQKKTPGQHGHRIVSSHNHDNTDSDSEYGEFPPLLSRMQVAACDDDIEHALDDDFEHALDDDFPPLESP